MTESALLACLALALLAFYRVVLLVQGEQPRRLGRVYGWLALFGVACGAAASAKLNGFSIAVAGGALALLLAARLNRPTGQKAMVGLLALAVVGVTALATFVAVDPYLWPDPAGRISAMIELRASTLEGQQRNYPEVQIQGVAERLEVVPWRVLETHAAFGPRNTLVVNALLLLVGLVAVVQRSRRAATRRAAGPATFTVLAVGFCAAGPALLTPLDWPRYYLLPVFFSAMLIAVGLATILQAAAGLLAGGRRRTKARAS